MSEDRWNPIEETYSTSGPICPHCGHEHQHDGGYFYDESLTEFDCEACGKEVEVHVYTSTSWTCSVPQQ
jgi:lysyl-tRNA synthetase class I